MFYRKVVFSLFFSLIAAFSWAQLQSPHEFIDGYEAQFTPHHRLVDYFEYMAANSEQIKLLPYGKTKAGRPLMIAMVSSPENIRDIENIRLNNLRKTGLEPGENTPSLDRVIVWLSYSVHGNEAGGSESSMLVLHQLADENNSSIQKWLENTIVIIDPCLNPDGYARYSNWYRDVAPQKANPTIGTVGHDEPWPKGRVNHYLFDLNRDWAWQTQVESEQRMVMYRQWMPHIHADFHEQYYQSPYYFAPASEPVSKFINQWQRDFQMEVAKNHAKYFDQYGWLYFTREIFDLYYPSYGDTYPMFNGAIGMTYEQAGHSLAGREIIMPNNDTLTLGDRIAHHTTTSLSTIEVASLNMERIIKNFEDYFQQAKYYPKGDYKAYVIKHTNNKDRMKALCQLLDKNGIKYGRPMASKRVDAFDYNQRLTLKLKLENNDLVISAAQPLGVLAQVLFNPNLELSDSLTYDITAWALPYAYGLEAYASKEVIEVQEGYDFPVFKPESPAYNHPYAYLCKWESMADARFLGALSKEGIQVRAASISFGLNGEPYRAGTLVITRADNRKRKNFDQIVQATANRYQRQLTGVKSGLSNRGPDLGSEKMKLLKQPRVAVLSGEMTNASSFGYVWSYFEQDLDYPIDIYRKEISRIDLDKYNVLIIPGGRFNFSFKDREKMKSWVQGGGQLIVVGRSNNEFANREGFALKRKEEIEVEGETNIDNLQPYDSHERVSISDNNPGAIFKVKMDNTNPLAFGQLKDYFSLKLDTKAYAYLEHGGNVGVLTEAPQIIGFVGHNTKEKLKGTLVFGVENIADGNVIYLIDNPLFRCFWENGKFIFSNAVFMVGHE